VRSPHFRNAAVSNGIATGKNHITALVESNADVNLAVNGRNMAYSEWTVKDLADALKRFPLDAKVYYEMGPNGPGTIGKAQYVKAWGESDEMGVLLDR
jgi:hypothetical protein